MSTPAVTPTPILEFPGYFAHQVHPENPTMQTLSEIEKVFEANLVFFQNVGKEQKLNGSLTTTLKFPFSNKTEKTEVKASDIDKKIAEDGEVSELEECLAEFYIKKISAIGLPRETTDYYLAMDYIEKNVLKNDLRQFAPSQLMRLLSTINGILCGKGLVGSKLRPTHGLVVTTDIVPKSRTKDDFKILDKYAKDHFTPAQFELWKTTRAKVWIAFKGTGKPPIWSKEERELVKDIMFISPYTDDVSKEYIKFCDEFCKKNKTEKDLYKFMAWAHMRFTEIHPFEDGVGRTARLLINIVRMQHGLNPILIDDDASYTKSIKQGEGAFAEYLKDLTARQVKPRPYIDDCLRYLFENTLEDAKTSQAQSTGSRSTLVSHLL